MRFLLYIVGAILVTAIVVAVIINIQGDDPVAGIFSQKLGPKARQAVDISRAISDRHQAGNILDGAVAKQVACGSAARNAFDPLSGENRFWFYQWPDGTLECYGTGGFHRITGEALMPLGKAQASVILGNQDKYPADDLWGPPAHRSRPSATPPAQAPSAPTIQSAPRTPVATATPVSESPCRDCGLTWSEPAPPIRQQ